MPCDRRITTLALANVFENEESRGDGSEAYVRPPLIELHIVDLDRGRFPSMMGCEFWLVFGT